jgi:hypothetical protein
MWDEVEVRGDWISPHTAIPCKESSQWGEYGGEREEKKKKRSAAASYNNFSVRCLFLLKHRELQCGQGHDRDFFEPFSAIGI